MRRLMVVTMLALMLTSLTGCGRSWRSWWNRGAECNGYEHSYSPCDSTIPYSHGAMLPPISSTPIVPGPVENLPAP